MTRRYPAGALGNLDMHAKNVGLIHSPSGSVRLAPAYDVVPHTHLHGVDGRMAMSIGREYRHAALTRDHLVAEIAGWGVRSAHELVVEALHGIAEVVDAEAPHPDADPEMHENIRRFTENLRRGRPAGAEPKSAS